MDSKYFEEEDYLTRIETIEGLVRYINTKNLKAIQYS